MWQILTIILGSGVVSALTSHFLAARAADKNFRREKLEQLYLAAEKYIQDSVENAVFYRRTGPIPENESADFEERRKDHDRLYHTCNMLTNLYFPRFCRLLGKICLQDNRCERRGPSTKWRKVCCFDCRYGGKPEQALVFDA